MMRKKLSKYANWLLVRDKAMFFCKWQVMWAGCVDTRPICKAGLRVGDYNRQRTSKDQMDKFFQSQRGKHFMSALGNASGDQFDDICRQQSFDLETLGEFTPEQLADSRGAKMPSHLALGLWNRVQALLHPTYFRINTILEYNSLTRMFIAQLEPLLETLREMRRLGEHPLGKTGVELKVEAHIAKAKQEIDDRKNAKKMALEGVGFNQIRVDARIRLSPSSGECLNTKQVAGTDMADDAGWARGYVFEFPDRMVGDLDLQEVWVDLVLPEDSSAFVFVAATTKVTGKPLHRSNVIKGRGMDLQQYRFQMSDNNSCEVACHHAVMVHITARNVPSKYAYWKEWKKVRQLNEILTIRPVECTKSLVMAQTDKHLSMQLVFGCVTGQEVLEADPSKRRSLASPATAETPLTPQTAETGGMGRPETSAPETDRPETAAAAHNTGTEDLHEKRKALQSSKSVRFFNEDTEGGISAKQLMIGKDKDARKLSKMRRSGKKTQLSRTRCFHGVRNMNKDMTMQRHANFASAFNPKFNEFWVSEDFPSPWIWCMDFDGKMLRKIQTFQDFLPNCMTIDSLGNVYMSDNQFCFYKFQHHRYWDVTYNVSADRMIRMWEFRDLAIGKPLLEKQSYACGVAIDVRNQDILYAAFSQGPILLLNTQKAALIGKIDPDPPFQCVSAMVCCSDVLVVGDSHQIKIFDLDGNQVSVLGQLYNDPCLFWTGLELYVGERRSTSWYCYQPKSAVGIELARQHERLIR